MALEVGRFVLEPEVLGACLWLWAAGYGSVILAVEATHFLVLVSLLGGPLLAYWLIARFRIPPCDPLTVTEVLGADLSLDRSKFSDLLDKTCGNGPSPDPARPEDPVILKTIAHRFAGLDAPENTLTALETCFKKGCIAVEFDVALTADGVAVVFHDNNLDRMTNVIGEINKMTWHDLSSLDVSINHPYHDQFVGTKIPLFEDVITQCLKNDMRIIIDIKDSSAEMTNIICKAYENHPMLYRRAIVTSFNPTVIYNIRSVKPGIIGAMSWRPYYVSSCNYSPVMEECIPYYHTLPAHYVARVADIITSWFFNNITYHLLGISVVLIHKDVITPELVNTWKRRNIRVMAWTVNIPSEKMHFSRNLQIPYLTDTMASE